MISAVGRYRLKGLIGEGAMAQVYRAHDPEIDRALAIKLLRKEFHGNREIVSRFLSEARAAGALSHPGIVTIFDVGEAEGVPYIAMELLQGRSLAALMDEEGRLSLQEVVSFGRQLSEALHFAHERGIVHRDLKPANVWVAEDRRTVKLLDFGIARRAEADQLRAEIEALRTQAGQVLGTPRYMSPEQALGRKVDYRSDFFSLGVVLYEMVTGKPAFDGNGLATIAIKITQEKPESYAKRLAECPKGLVHIIDRLMAKDPGKRYANGADVARAFLREERNLLSADSAPRHWTYTTQLIAQAALVIGFVLAFSAAAIHERESRTMKMLVSTSGNSIASFVAKNAALSVADNAGLPPDQQDWVPLQAFIASAATDPNIAELRVIDGEGIVRASTAGAGEVGAMREGPQVTPIAPRDARRFPFEQPIIYGGRNFGTVQLALSTTAFDKAITGNTVNLILLSLLIFVSSLACTMLLSSRLVAPLRTLRQALGDISRNNFDYRISHSRRDEFGELFDTFNELAGRLQREREGQSDTSENADPPIDIDATIVAPAFGTKHVA